LQTIEALGVRFETDKRVAPDVGPTSILDAAGWPEAGGAVIVVGHQPTLGEVAAELLEAGGGIAIPKGAIWWFATKGPHAEVKLVAVMRPDLAKD
jgi:phosphohistidine phosphatase